MRTKKQSYLPGFKLSPTNRFHGGESTVGKRKTVRPIDPKQTLHVILKSSQARGEQSMLHPKHVDHIHDYTHKVAKKWGIKLYRYANVGNHIHLLVKVPSRALWQRFIRELSGGIAIIVTGAKKGSGLSKNKTHRGFWDYLAFTRIVAFGRDFKNMKTYLVKNLFEAYGVPMKKLLAQGRKIMGFHTDKSIVAVPFS